MPTVSERGDCQLIRPFLEIPRARLTATLETRGHEWIDDPSNHSDDFERIRIRKRSSASPRIRPGAPSAGSERPPPPKSAPERHQDGKRIFSVPRQHA